MFTLKYFSFKDPVTGELTKGYGRSFEHTGLNSRIKFRNGAAVVEKFEHVTVQHESAPVGAELTEITKEEFDALDVSKESVSSTVLREQTTLQDKKREQFATLVKEPVTSTDLAEKFEEAIDTVLVGALSL